MQIGEHIKILRERYGLSQAEMGEIAHVSDKAISSWENGTRLPRMGAIERMANYFGITKSELIEGESSSSLSTDEWKLIDLYRNAEESARQFAYEMLEHHQKAREAKMA